mmetsp:Transcript_21860/g.47652  ORF Transcript_21860/g.47652 Transcript_21860/m.47652 type:complete len:1152 (-) Transcript_21860:1444-4899(-)
MACREAGFGFPLRGLPSIGRFQRSPMLHITGCILGLLSLQGAAELQESASWNGASPEFAEHPNEVVVEDSLGASSAASAASSAAMEAALADAPISTAAAKMAETLAALAAPASGPGPTGAEEEAEGAAVTLPVGSNAATATAQAQDEEGDADADSDASSVSTSSTPPSSQRNLRGEAGKASPDEKTSAEAKEVEASSTANQGWTPWDSSLSSPSDSKLMTFYAYRAVSDEVYPPINVNTASLGGVLWYLHHEVVIQYPRKFKITKIMRLKIQYRATTPLLESGMHFGPRLAYDLGQCTGPFVCGRDTKGGVHPKFCGGAFDTQYENNIRALNGKPFEHSYEYSKFGYHVGCNNLGEYPFPMYKVYYPDAVWYSFPGPCLSDVYYDRSENCAEKEPGGLCPEGQIPTGAGDCTWSYEVMGEVTIDEVVGLSASALNAEGGREYDPFADKGYKFSFWNGINDTKANLKRMKALEDAFLEKYPNQTTDTQLPAPKCDFNFGAFYREFWYKNPFVGKCKDAEAGSACAGQINWVLNDGRYSHPEWFPYITPKSTFKDVQRLLHAQGKEACPYRPCDDFVPPQGFPLHGDEGVTTTTTTASATLPSESGGDEGEAKGEGEGEGGSSSSEQQRQQQQRQKSAPLLFAAAVTSDSPGLTQHYDENLFGSDLCGSTLAAPVRRSLEYPLFKAAGSDSREAAPSMGSHQATDSLSEDPVASAEGHPSTSSDARPGCAVEEASIFAQGDAQALPPQTRPMHDTSVPEASGPGLESCQDEPLLQAEDGDDNSNNDNNNNNNSDNNDNDNNDNDDANASADLPASQVEVNRAVGPGGDDDEAEIRGHTGEVIASQAAPASASPATGACPENSTIAEAPVAATSTEEGQEGYKHAEDDDAASADFPPTQDGLAFDHGAMMFGGGCQDDSLLLMHSSSLAFDAEAANCTQFYCPMEEDEEQLGESQRDCPSNNSGDKEEHSPTTVARSSFEASSSSSSSKAPAIKTSYFGFDSLNSRDDDHSGGGIDCTQSYPASPSRSQFGNAPDDDDDLLARIGLKPAKDHKKVEEQETLLFDDAGDGPCTQFYDYDMNGGGGGRSAAGGEDEDEPRVPAEASASSSSSSSSPHPSITNNIVNIVNTVNRRRRRAQDVHLRLRPPWQTMGDGW